MKAKFPLISYVVTTRFMTNTAGMRYLHKEVFTDDDPRISKRKAEEYFEAAIECLIDIKEISVYKPDTYSKEKIVYKNPDSFNGGVTIFLRLNNAVELNENIYNSGRTFFLQTFAELDKHLMVKKHIGKKMEQKLWNMMASKNDKKSSSLNDYLIKKGLKHSKEQKLVDRISFNDTAKMQIVRDLSEIKVILASVCAFLNTDGGEIVIGIGENLLPTGFMSKDAFMKYTDVFEIAIYTMFHGFTDLIEIEIKQINETSFYYLKINKSARPAFLREKHGAEFYYRNVAGNVLDFDRAE